MRLLVKPESQELDKENRSPTRLISSRKIEKVKIEETNAKIGSGLFATMEEYPSDLKQNYDLNTVAKVTPPRS